MGGQRKKKGGRVTPIGGVPLGRLSADEMSPATSMGPP
jgi:hypothetical protein